MGADGSVANRYLWGPGVNQLLADDNYALGLASPTLWAWATTRTRFGTSFPATAR